MRGLALSAGLCLCAGPVAAFEVTTATYVCERGVTLPVAYVNADEDSAAALTVEGRQIALISEPSGSGARYTWPSDGAGYVWWTKGETAMLLWRDGATGAETTLMADCRAL